MELIGYILIGICCFYLLRNIWAGYVLYPMTEHIITMYDKQLPKDMRRLLRSRYTRRNYYLFVLNPLWWSIEDVFERKEVREDIRYIAKNLRNFK